MRTKLNVDVQFTHKRTDRISGEKRYIATIRHNGIARTFNYFHGEGIEKAYPDDLLYNLIMEYSTARWECLDAKDYASVFGVEWNDPERRNQVEQTWRQLEKNADKMDDLFSEDEIDQLSTEYEDY